MTTIFVTNFHTLASRNFFTTDVFLELKGQTQFQFIFFVPLLKLDFFNQNYKENHIHFIGIKEVELKQSLGYRISKVLSMAMIPTLGVKHRLGEICHRAGRAIAWRKYYFNRLLANTLGRFLFFRKLMQAFNQWLIPTDLIDSYFEDYNPQSLILTDIFSDLDCVFSLAAKKKGIKTIGMIRSWDNTTTKGLLRIRPKWAIANNDIIKKEGIKYHGLKDYQFKITGIPQFDHIFSKQFETREQFFEKIGADPKKRLILFAPAGSALSDVDWQLCQIFKEALDQGDIPSDIQFLIRCHPGSAPNLEKFKGDARFIVDLPGHKFGDHHKTPELRLSDQHHLANSLYHSEIICFVHSTIGLDSLPLDKPQILIGFDGWETKPYWETSLHYIKEEHFNNFVKTKAVAIAKTKEDFFYWVKTYLQEPALHREERAKAAKDQLWSLDGKSGKRVAKAISQFIGDNR